MSFTNRRGPLPTSERPCERCALTRLALDTARRRLGAAESHVARLERIIGELAGKRAVPPRPEAMMRGEAGQ